MTVIIELKKVEQQDLNLLKNVLNDYTKIIQMLGETFQDIKYSKDMSIAIETWYDLNRKTTAQFPPKETLLKLSLHKAYVLQNALQEYAKNCDNSYEKSKCNRFVMAIDQQLPTDTQLAIQ